MPWIEPITLTGRVARLEPLDEAHADELIAAAQDGELWQIWTTSVPSPANMIDEIRRRLGLRQQGSMLPFTVRRVDNGRAVGMTTYMNVDARNQRLEIGSTWYARSVQRSALNTECKRMLLGHAFDDLGCIAVEFRTHFMNLSSRRAIERLGAKLDGILRHHSRLPDGSLRDTCVYSIIQPEWPSVRMHLDWELNRAR